MAGGKAKFLALKTKTPFLDINHGRSHPYAGYEGMVTFAKQLDLTVNNPIWPLLNSPEPWETDAAPLVSAARSSTLLTRICPPPGWQCPKGSHGQSPEKLPRPGGNPGLSGD